MPIWHNNVSMPFAYNAKRLNLKYRSYFDFMSQVSKLGAEKGLYGRFTKLGSYGEETLIESVFCDEQGYLLGEYVRSKFPVDEENIIYCEQVDADGTSILVVVQLGRIIIDTVLPPGPVSHEYMLPIVGSGIKHSVAIAGRKVVLHWDEAEDATHLPGHCIDKSQRLETGFVLEAAAIDKALQVLPNSKAIKVAGLQPVNFKAIGISAVLAIIAGVGYFGSIAQQEPDTPQTVQVDLYKDYRTTLATPSPAANILVTAATYGKASLIPGWKIKEAGLSASNTFAEMIENGGSVGDLEDYAAKHGMVVRRSEKAVMLYDRRITKPREAQQHLYEVSDVLSHLSEMAHIAYDAIVAAQEMVVTGKVYRREVKVTLRNALLDDVAMYAESLADLPVVLKNIKITPQGAYMLVDIDLTIYGSNRNTLNEIKDSLRS